jgi:hypothetical protein
VEGYRGRTQKGEVMNTAAVGLTLCVALVREFLSGYRGYPNTESGEKRFAMALQSNALSVDHARAILESFDEAFPTVKQINDTAWNLRPKFETPDATKKEWERIYGKPKAFDRTPLDELTMHWQAFRDMLYYTEGPGVSAGGYWSDARQRAFDPERGHAESIAFIRSQIADMGWPAIMALKSSPLPFPYVNPKRRQSSRAGDIAPVAAPVITQADIDRAQQSRKTTAQVDMELDGWADPDR